MGNQGGFCYNSVMQERYNKYIAIGLGVVVVGGLVYYRLATDRYVKNQDLTEPLREATRVSKKRANLSYQDRQRFRNILKWPQECEREFSNSTLKDFSGLVFFEVDSAHSLVMVQCNQGGYSGYAQYLWLNETREPFVVQLLQFASYANNDDQLVKITTSYMTGEPTFNPQTKLLTIVNGFQTNLNCGVATTYKFENNLPVLVQARGTTQCYYPGTPNPTSWPTLPL